MNMIYLDNAASSWPKPTGVVEAMGRAVNHYGANPGRGSHAMAVQASRMIFNTRKHIASLIGTRNPNDVVFTSSTTMALNMAIKGMVKEGDHVLCTSVEHNSVRRPLEYLKQSRNIQVSYMETDLQGHLDVNLLSEALQVNTKMIVCTHSSNLLGSILPMEQIAEWANKHKLYLVVDAAQTAGTLPIHVEKMGIHMLAFPGHKGLLGPQGTGGLYIAPDVELEPLLHGGTGSQSEAVNQPTVRPDRYESGTLNTPGIAGLGEGVQYVLKETVEKIHAKEWSLTQKMMDGLSSVPGIRLLGPDQGEERTGIVSFLLATVEASEIAYKLDRNYNIAVRAGFHCTPLSHKSAGTESSGAVRASVSYFTTEDEVNALIEAVHEIAKNTR